MAERISLLGSFLISFSSLTHRAAMHCRSITVYCGPFLMRTRAEQGNGTTASHGLGPIEFISKRIPFASFISMLFNWISVVGPSSSPLSLSLCCAYTFSHFRPLQFFLHQPHPTVPQLCCPSLNRRSLTRAPMAATAPWKCLRAALWSPQSAGQVHMPSFGLCPTVLRLAS